MLNYRKMLTEKFPKKIFLGLGFVSLTAIANSLFSLEHEWHLLSISTLMIGGSLLFMNLRQSLAPVIDQPQAIDRRYLFKELEQVQKAIAKIANSNKRAYLAQQSQQISQNLEKNHFRIVVFGTGSAGKTSVVNALLGRQAGKTGAEIGTTIASEAYEYQGSDQGIDFSAVGIAAIHSNTHPNKNSESKVKRQISLLDTSGTQEMGEMGKQRELESLKVAQNADLMIFVTAGDLTNSEYRELDRLAATNKRIILAFNKTDSYLPSDREIVLAKLQERTQDFLVAADIIAIAAQPSPIKVRQYANTEDAISSNTLKEWWEALPPDVDALKKRIESILSNEWEQLLIDNTHLQIKNLWQEINGTINQERREDATTIINRYQIIAATTVFANPIPALDLLAGAAINTQMLIELAKIYDRPLNFKQAQQLATTIAQQLLQLGCIEIATSAIASGFKLNAVTYAIGGSIQAFTAAYLTHIGGTSFVEYLEQQPEFVITANPEMINKLQKICQQTFTGLQGDRFFLDFVNNISGRISAFS